MNACFFTIADDRYYYAVGTPILVNSFKRFHPEIDLIVFRQNTINRVFRDHKINFFMAKPTFAKLLTDKYDKVVNIDADTIILDRLDEVLKDDYEVGAPWNYNDYENMSEGNVTEEMFLQAGLVASTNKLFWDIWEWENKEAMQYRCQENSVLNLIWYNHPEIKKMKKKIFDKDKDYYGCKSLGREGEFYIKDNKVMCRNEQVKAYHWARGLSAMPKMQWDKLPFIPEVKDYLNNIGHGGVSVKYGNL